MAMRPMRKAIALTTPLALTAAVALVAHAPFANAQATIQVTTMASGIDADTDCSLQEAILAANWDDSLVPLPDGSGAYVQTGCDAGSGADVIELTPGATYTLDDIVDDAANYMGPTATPLITSDITIEGHGAVLQHSAAASNFRLFAIDQRGRLDLREVDVKGFHTKGGNGAGGGGGGLGAGGAIYVYGGTLLVQRSTFEGNSATGGNGSHNWGEAMGGGGGGLGGDGGGYFSGPFAGGGGGGGARGRGGDGDLDNFAGGAGGGGGGTLADGESGDNNEDTSSGPRAGGERCGGAGGYTDVGFGGDDGEAGSCAGGGGGGGESFRPIVGALATDGNGGDGAYGGGGGGAGYDVGAGGHGGFGGGGGAGTYGQSDLDGFGPHGGDGGFGGGGGAGSGGYITGGPGSGGTFAGAAGERDGGGGAGLGGAIFGHRATITVINSTFTGNYVLRGEAGGTGAHNGGDAGGAIFAVSGSLNVLSSTIAGNDSTGNGAAITAYAPSTGDDTSFALFNTIIADNGGHDACFTRNGDGNSVDTTGSNNLIVPTASDVETACPGIAETTDPHLGPLQLNDPGTTPTMAISVTSLAYNTGTATGAPAEDQRGVPRPQLGGYDIGAYEYALPPDTTPPTDAPTQSPAANGYGWNNTDVTVSWNWTDAESGIDPSRCHTATTSSGEGAGISLGAACYDLAGNGAIDTYYVNVDKTAPTVTCDAAPTFTVGGSSDADVTATVTDTLSGPVASTVSADVTASDVATPGVKAVNLTGEDKAGNATTVSCTYTVAYRFLGFLEPIPQSSYKRGSTIPVKFRLGDASGKPLPDATALALLTPSCHVQVTLDGVVKGCATYDATSNTFQFDVKTSKSLAVGGHAVGIRVTAPDGSGVLNTDSTTVLIRK